MSRVRQLNTTAAFLCPRFAMTGASVLCLFCITWTTAAAQELGSPQDPESPILITVTDLEPAWTQGPVRGSTHLRLTIALSVRNVSSQPVRLERSQWSLLLNGNEAKNSVIASGTEIPDTVLGPSDEISGRLTFTEVVNEQEEPSLVLKWLSGSQLTFAALNEDVRRLYQFQQTLIGPDHCLLILTCRRNVDLLATWVLRDQLPEFHARGIRRIVIADSVPVVAAQTSETGDSLTVTGSQLQVTDEALAVLATLMEDPSGGMQAAQPGFPIQLAVPGKSGAPLTVQFLSLQLAGFSRPTVRRMMVGAGNSVPIHRDLSGAITAALLPVYVRIDADRAFADIRQSEPGLQRAALEGCLDRISATQVTELLQLLKQSGPETQQLITSCLHRVPGQDVVPVLESLSLSDDPIMSATALTSLTQCTTADSDRAVRQIWDASENQPALRQRLVEAALRSEDYRWCNLLAKRAAQLLQHHAGLENSGGPADLTDSIDSTRLLSEPRRTSGLSLVAPPAPTANPETPASPESPPPPEAPQDPQEEQPRVGANPASVANPPSGTSPTSGADPSNAQSSLAAIDAAHLRRILEFLKLNHDTSVFPALRTYLPAIQDPAVQDVVAEFLLQIRADRDVPLFRALLADRLASRTITDTIRSVVAAYPSPDWTEALLNDFRFADSGTRTQQKSLSAALRCATTNQLADVVENFAQLDGKSQESVMTHLASVRYPGWHAIARTAIEQRHGVADDAIRILAQEGSDESVRVLTTQLQTMLDASWTPESADVMPRRLLVRSLISALSSYSLPECRRIVNRSMRHADTEIRQQAIASVSAGIRRSPGGALLSEVMLLKSEQKFTEALTKVEECLRADEFLPDAYLFRAALRLRDGRLDDARRDLEIADRLNPEEPSTLSTIALVMVRAGELDAGLKLADQTLKLDPEESSNLYNAACVYARAAERGERTPEQKSADLARAVELLTKSTAAGFEDTDHLLSDPDLVSLHQLPQWSEIMAAVESNSKKQQAVQP